MISKIRPPSKDDDRAKQDLYKKVNEIITSVNIGTSDTEPEDSSGEGVTSLRTTKIDKDEYKLSVKTNDGYRGITFDRGYWDDMRVPMSAIRVAGANAADEVAWDVDGGSTFIVLGFDKTTDEYAYFTAQLPHSWIEGTDIECHVHWTIPDTDDGGETVTWDLDYTWVNIGDVMASHSNITATETLAGQATGTHIYTDMGWLDGSGMTISSMILGRISRDVSEDNYDHDAYLLELDFHFQTDGRGSRTETTK